MKNNFKTNRQGAVVGLIVMITSIFCVAILFAIGMVAPGVIWETVLQYPLPVQAIQTINLMNTVSGITLIVLVIGCIVYGWALAHKRDPYDMPG